MKIILVLTFLVSSFSFASQASFLAAQREMSLGNYSEVINILLPEARAGDAAAQSVIAGMYYDGHGVAKDYTEAANWYELAADQNYPLAQHYMGIAYYKGEGRIRDVEKAMKYFHDAGENNYSESWFMLGKIYEDGNYSTLFVKNPDFSKARFFYEKAASKNNMNAMVNLSIIYAYGKGVPKNYNEAFRLAKRAADLGSERAQTLLGLYYSSGVIIDKNLNTAIKWFLKSADKGDSIAVANMGEIFEDKSYIHSNPILAYALYNLASVNEPEAISLRDKLSKRLSSSQINDGQKITAKMQRLGIKKVVEDYMKNKTTNLL